MMAPMVMELVLAILSGMEQIVPLPEPLLPFKPNLQTMVLIFCKICLHFIYLFCFAALSFTITFDIDTNMGGQMVHSSFFCSEILDPVTTSFLDELSVCNWDSQRILNVSTNNNSTIQVSSSVVLRNNTIFASVGSISATVGALLLVSPDNLVVPSIAISGPSTVGSCEGIVSRFFFSFFLLLLFCYL